jgi:hypothetical protein
VLVTSARTDARFCGGLLLASSRETCVQKKEKTTTCGVVVRESPRVERRKGGSEREGTAAQFPRPRVRGAEKTGGRADVGGALTFGDIATRGCLNLFFEQQRPFQPSSRSRDLLFTHELCFLSVCGAGGGGLRLGMDCSCADVVCVRGKVRVRLF